MYFFKFTTLILIGLATMSGVASAGERHVLRFHQAELTALHYARQQIIGQNKFVIADCKRHSRLRITCDVAGFIKAADPGAPQLVCIPRCKPLPIGEQENTFLAVRLTRRGLTTREVPYN